MLGVMGGRIWGRGIEDEARGGRGEGLWRSGEGEFIVKLIGWGRVILTFAMLVVVLLRFERFRVGSLLIIYVYTTVMRATVSLWRTGSSVGRVFYNKVWSVKQCFTTLIRCRTPGNLTNSLISRTSLVLQAPCQPASYCNLEVELSSSVIEYATDLYPVRTFLECQIQKMLTCEIRCVGAILLS